MHFGSRSCRNCQQILRSRLCPRVWFLPREGKDQMNKFPYPQDPGVVFRRGLQLVLSFIGRNVGVDISNMFNNASLFEVERSVWKTYPCHLATS